MTETLKYTCSKENYKTLMMHYTSVSYNLQKD